MNRSRPQKKRGKIAPLGGVAALLLCAVFIVALRSRQATEASPPQGAIPLARIAVPGPAAEPLAASILPEPSARPAALTPAPARGAKEPPADLIAACGEENEERRSERIQSALRTWAATDVEAAGAWARRQTYLARAVALAAVVNGAAAGDAEAAERFVAKLTEAESDQAAEYGAFLIFALGETGDHARAAAWAGRGEELRIDWFQIAYGRWARQDPAAAWRAAGLLENPDHRQAAAYATLGMWARERPRELAETAARFPAGPEKNFALVAAVRAWAEREPQTAAEWMLAHREAFDGVPKIETILED